LGGPFSGHFRMSLNYGRRRSFSASSGFLHPTRNRPAPESRGSSRASTPPGCASLRQRAAATRSGSRTR
jgi:hypothetical protein